MTRAESDRCRVDVTPRARTIKQLTTPTKQHDAVRTPGSRTPHLARDRRVTFNCDEDGGDLALSANGAILIAEPPERGCTTNAREHENTNAARLLAQDVPVGAKGRRRRFLRPRARATGRRKRTYFELNPLRCLRRLSSWFSLRARRLAAMRPGLRRKGVSG